MGNCALINVKRMLDNGGDKFLKKAYKARRVNEWGAKLRLAVLAYPIYSHLRKIKGFFNEFYFDLNLEDVEKILSNVISKEYNLNVNIVKSYYPELAIDVDSKRDKKYIENYLTNSVHK